MGMRGYEIRKFFKSLDKAGEILYIRVHLARRSGIALWRAKGFPPKKFLRFFFLVIIAVLFFSKLFLLHENEVAKKIVVKI